MKNFFYALVSSLVLSSCGSSELTIATQGFTLEIDNKGFITSISSTSSGAEYLYSQEQAPLLALQVDSVMLYPTASEWSEEAGIMSLQYGGDIIAKLAIKQTDKYARLDLVEVEHPQDKHIDLAIWGSYPTTIKGTVGECVGVVSDSTFAFGIRALNPKTIGGYPSNENDIDPFYDIFATNSIVDVEDSVKVLYRGHTAMHTDYGSKVHAYVRNRDKDRVIEQWGHKHYFAPAYDDGGVIGSAIALFGAPKDQTMDYLEAIVVGEDMPYPQISGSWNKTNPDAAQAYIIYPFNENNIQQALDFTKSTGLKYLYHGGPFKTWGKFELSADEFPTGVEGMKQCVETAAKQGVKLGVHTLSNFTTTNDGYVSPVPDKRLGKVGSSTLVGDISADATEIEISSPMFFNQMGNNSLHGVMVGEELIRYKRVSDSAPWKLIDCERGAWGTKASNHSAGDTISKLIDHPYNVFLTDIELTKEQSHNLAELFNNTGLEQISFDGLEGAWSTGLGQYGLSIMIKEWWDKLRPELRNNINDASMTTHYNWYIFTRMNWGEPWYAGFRESQMAYRLMNQDFYRRNLMPSMLGWFKYDETTSIEDLEWLMARSAAFDAGYTLVTDGDAVKGNGNSPRLIKAIREWENARLSLAFPKELKLEMENTENEYTLTETSSNTWDLYPYSVQRFEHKNFVRQPGEPSLTKWKFDNPYSDATLEMLIKANDDISNITISVGGFATIEVPFSLKEGQTLKYEGADKMVVYDKHWNPVKEFAVNQSDFDISKGESTITFSCNFKSSSNEKAVKAELKTKGEKQVLTAKRTPHTKF